MAVPAGKITVPRLPSGFVPRPAVHERLERAAPTDLVVVSAPAGYGKSVVLADWARRHPADVAWVTLDATDNDPARLWAAVRAALRSCAALPPTGALHGTRSGHDRSDLVDDLIAAVDELDRPVRLVLDDVQELTSAESLHDLARLLRLRPPMLRPVLAGRVDPPIALPRFRVEGRLHEVRAEHLRFSPDETRALLRSSELALTPDQVDALLARTEGWAAGLRLAVFALRRTDDPDRFLAEFSGDDRSVADYLTGEMLSGLDPETLDFARSVSVCSLLSTELAAELSGRPDAGLLLDRLGHTTALVARTGPDEHRIQTLLRSYLLAHLQRRSPSRYRELHACAARWWAGRDEPAHALRHAERAGDDALLAEVLRGSAVGMLLRGELDALRHGLVAVGTTARRADPALALPAAIAHLERGARDAAAAELEHARRAWPGAPSPALAALRLSTELLASAQGIDVAVCAPPSDAIDDAELEALLHVSRGAALLARRADRATARTELESAVAIARALGLAFLEAHSLTLLASLAIAEGDGRAMTRFAEEALTAAPCAGRRPAAGSAAPSSFLAYAELLGGEPAAAADRAAAALSAPDRLAPEVAFTLHAVHGAARADRGEGVAGLAEMRAARMRYDGAGEPPEFCAALAVLEHRTAVLLGNPGAAAAVVDWLGQRTGHVGEISLMRAWVEAAAGRHEAAVSLVDPLLSGTEPALLAHTPLEVLLLRLESELRAGNGRTARATLREAVATGRSLDVVRPFALAGTESRAVLTAWIAAPAHDPFTARIARALAAVRPESGAPLSERETAVLALLPSLLSAREIAAELTVSVNTVKTHIRAIYTKLGVASRREAVRRAQERNLLP